MTRVDEHSNGGEVLERYCEIALGVFAWKGPTAEDHSALANHLAIETAKWVFDRYWPAEAGAE